MKNSDGNKTKSSPDKKQDDFVIVEKNETIPVTPKMDPDDVVVILNGNRDVASYIDQLERDNYKAKSIAGSNLYKAEYDPDYYFYS